MAFFPYFSQAEGARRQPSSQPQEPQENSKELRPLGYYEYRFYKSFGGIGSGHGSFEHPVDIGVDRDDNIYVCDMEAGRIQRFDSEGNFDEEWDRFYIGADIPFRQSDRMDSPEALCVDYKQRISRTIIYVADTKNNRILQFDRQGRLIDPEGNEIGDDPKRWKNIIENDLLWGEFGSRPGKFHHPTDIAVDGHDNCYILDSKNSRVQCFDDTGNFKFEWGSFGSGPGSFLKPIRLSYDQSGFGSIWVLDSKDGRLHQFDLRGNFIRALQPRDKQKNPLPKPTDFCFDNQGFIYLTDRTLEKIFKYNNDLEFIQTWGEQGTGPGQFKGPMGIAVDQDDRVLVVDSGNCRIQVFRQF